MCCGRLQVSESPVDQFLPPVSLTRILDHDSSIICVIFIHSNSLFQCLCPFSCLTGRLLLVFSYCSPLAFLVRQATFLRTIDLCTLQGQCKNAPLPHNLQDLGYIYSVMRHEFCSPRGSLGEQSWQNVCKNTWRLISSAHRLQSVSPPVAVSSFENGLFLFFMSTFCLRVSTYHVPAYFCGGWKRPPGPDLFRETRLCQAPPASNVSTHLTLSNVPSAVSERC